MLRRVDSGVASLKAMCSPTSASCANKTDQKGRKKKKKRTLVDHRCKYIANNNEFEKKNHLRRAFQGFCPRWHPSYKWYMLEYPTFFHISSKNPDDADIANRKHYSAPEGALTMFSCSELGGFGDETDSGSNDSRFKFTTLWLDWETFGKVIFPIGK